MTDPIRALCAELCAELDHSRRCLLNDATLTHPLADRARAALAEPVAEPPAPPAEGEIDQLVSRLRDYAQGEADNGWHDDAARFRRAAELLAQAHSTPPAPVPEPVAVSDRPWERKGWCDKEGRFWAEHISRSGVASWRFAAASDLGGWAFRCLPFHALTLPAPQGGEVEP